VCFGEFLFKGAVWCIFLDETEVNITNGVIINILLFK